MRINNIHRAIVGLGLLGLVGSASAALLTVNNPSFEAPAVDPNAFPALPMVEGWIEQDLDTTASANTGVFANTSMDSPDHINNAEGRQLAFLGSEQGNALEQNLDAAYQAGHAYRLSVGVGISAQFPPAQVVPVDMLDLALTYNDGNEPVDVAVVTLPAAGLSSTVLQHVFVVLPTVRREDPWANQSIGIEIRAAGAAGGFWDLDDVQLEELISIDCPIENASFESPQIDPNAFPAWPMVDGWIENDLDGEGSANTGVFANTAIDSPDHIGNADDRQLAFLGSELGNGLQQDLSVVYQPGCEYHLSVGVAVSALFPPSVTEPVDSLELVYYYRDGNDVVDISSDILPATGWTSTSLTEASVHLGVVNADDPWANQPIGIAIRAQGAAGGFWDLDRVRLTEWMSSGPMIENPSFETPGIDPNAFPALPMVDGWIENDLDVESSTNTGVFANTPIDTPEHISNADNRQLAFLGSEQGNALEQILETPYQIGHRYRLTVAVGISALFPPAQSEPADTLQLAFYYVDDHNPVDIAQVTLPATGLSSTMLKDFSVYLPAVQTDDAWVDQPIGIALRATGAAGGFWDLDQVRLGAAPVKE